VPRKSSKQTRIDGLDQFGKRKYKKKNSPNRHDDGRGWTDYLLEQLQKRKPNGK
jgi:hypothetical protein